MERKDAVILTNMCMVYDDLGNVLVEDKITKNSHGIIFPGGHVEEREAIVDSVIREVYEETGLIIDNVQPCGLKDWVEEDGSRYIVFLYKTNSFRGELKSSDEGKVFWTPMDNLKNMNLLWHLEKMLHIFCGDEYSEIYFDRCGDSSVPLLK